jgi:hypothetical protein
MVINKVRNGNSTKTMMWDNMHPLYATKIGYACPSPKIDPYLTHFYFFF